MKKVLSLVLVLVMALSLVACGSGSSASTASSGTQSSTTQAAATPAPTKELGVIQQSAAGSGEVVEESDRILNMPNVVLLGNVDPCFVSSIDGMYITWQVYEGLVKYDEKTGEVYPRIAESWTYADDNSYIDFKINPAVTFHNGDKVTPEDVIWSYDSIKAQGKFGRNIDSFSSWEKIDDSTVRFYLSGTTTTPLLYMSEMLITSKKVAEEAGDAAFTTPETSVGTGPFYFTEIDFDGDIVAMAYPDYYRGKANIGGIKWTYLTDSSTALAAFQTGTFDFAKLPTANVAEMEATGQYNVIHAASTHNSFIGINYEKVPNQLVRQAILYALDNEAIMNVTYNGLGVVSHNMAESGMIAGGYSFDDYYNYNPEKSHELLLEAGYTEDEIKAGIPIGNIVAMSTNYYAKVATVVQEMLRQVGLIAEVTTFEQANVEELWYRRGEGSADMALVCHGDNIKVDTGVFFTNYIACRSAANGATNAEKWGLEGKVQELGSAAASEYDQAKRNELWQQFWEELKEQAIYYSLFHRDNMFIATKDLNVVWGVNYYHVYDWSWNQ